MGMSEVTAVAVVYKELQLARKAIFPDLQEKARPQLDCLVDEPEFVELFQFVVECGARRSTYIEELLSWAEKYVQSKFRKLRLAAFTAVNKINVNCPLCKVAAVKRAYRKIPSYGYCPNPEAAWGKFWFKELEPLEQVLRFFLTQRLARDSKMRQRRLARTS